MSGSARLALPCDREADRDADADADREPGRKPAAAVAQAHRRVRRRLAIGEHERDERRDADRAHHEARDPQRARALRACVAPAPRDRGDLRFAMRIGVGGHAWLVARAYALLFCDAGVATSRTYVRPRC